MELTFPWGRETKVSADGRWYAENQHREGTQFPECSVVIG